MMHHSPSLNGFLSRNRWKIIFGVTATSIIVTLTLNPLAEVKQKVISTAPWVGAGILVSEIMFIGGLAMMASAVGMRVGNPFRLKTSLAEICKRANRDLLFKAGFWINTVGAIGTAVVISIGVFLNLPPESYGILSFAVADLALTVAIRKAMLDGLKETSASVA
ncbi:hypothetical protein [Streptomyces sp. NPDC098781]|uniref:hypothetical protein n=1 Tax=Streptomyces sp. NPDC098781 TaxID=3366097 RepID=UPI0038062393